MTSGVQRLTRFDPKITNLKVTQSQMTEVCKVLKDRQMPQTRITLWNAISFIESEIKALSESDDLNLLEKEILSEWESIEAILKTINMGREVRPKPPVKPKPKSPDFTGRESIRVSA